MAAGAERAGAAPLRVMFVCLGNICRSPTAEAVMRAKAAKAGVAMHVESSGTGGWHVGEGAHPPTVEAGEKAGYDLRRHRAQQFKAEHVRAFDLVVAMDRSNERDIRWVASKEDLSKLRLFCSFAPELKLTDVPDPWYEGNFDEVVRICEAGCDGILAHLRDRRT